MYKFAVLFQANDTASVDIGEILWFNVYFDVENHTRAADSQLNVAIFSVTDASFISEADSYLSNSIEQDLWRVTVQINNSQMIIPTGTQLWIEFNLVTKLKNLVVISGDIQRCNSDFIYSNYSCVKCRPGTFFDKNIRDCRSCETGSISTDFNSNECSVLLASIQRIIGSAKPALWGKLQIQPSKGVSGAQMARLLQIM
jgi:hypothetical protein